MPLQNIYRPKTLDELYGNAALVKSLKLALERENQEDIPSAFFFHGDAGCGKTTMAYILKEHFEVSDQHFRYYDAANTRGIDTVRTIREIASYGGKMLFVLDECFHKDTKIKTPSGEIKIKDIKEGNPAYSLNGIDSVEKKFVNNIPLGHLAKLYFSNGETTFTTKDHLYFTENGWIEAQNLKNNLLFAPLSGKLMQNTNLLEEAKNGNKDLCLVQSFIQNTKNKAKMLLHELCSKIKKQFSGMEKKSLHKRVEREALPSKNRVQSNRERERACPQKLNQDEKEKPIMGSKNSRIGKTNKAVEWIFAYLERSAWWERSLHPTTNAFIPCAGMGNGSCYLLGEKRTGIPYQLQSRHRKSATQIGNRNRWTITQLEEEYKKRFKKDKKTERIRVDRVEIYKRGSNEQSFSGIVGDREKSQGFIQMFDLQMKNHPSYFANGAAVHNCHQLTGPAQEGLLLPLQDPIPNKYFVLCTTEPGKIKLTIKRRCFNGEVKALTFREMGKFLDDIIESELGDDRLDHQVYQEIIKHSNGSPGLALNLLDSVIDVVDKKEALEILSQWTTESDSRNIGRAVHNNRWREVQKILSTTENSQVERMRQGIMGYLRKVMLDQKNNSNVTGEAAAKLAIFLEVTPDQHINGLASACYMATHLSEPNDIPF